MNLGKDVPLGLLHLLKLLSILIDFMLFDAWPLR